MLAAGDDGVVGETRIWCRLSWLGVVVVVVGEDEEFVGSAPPELELVSPLIYKTKKVVCETYIMTERHKYI